MARPPNPSHYTPPMQRRHRLGLLLVALSLLAFSTIWWLRRGPSELERWQTKMRARGEKLALKDFARPRLNSFDDTESLLAAVTRFAGRSWQTSGPVFDRLPEPPPGQRRVAWAQDFCEGYDGISSDWDSLRKQLDQAKPAIDALAQRMEDPLRDPGWDYSQWTVSRGIPGLVAYRTTAQSIANAVLLQLHNHENPSALARLIVLFRLSQVYREGYLLVNQMVRLAVLRLAVDALWQALQAPGWTDAQLAQLQHELGGRPRFLELSKTMEIERAIGGQVAADWRKGNSASLSAIASGGFKVSWQNYVLIPAWKTIWSRRDELFFCRIHQEYIETLRSLDRMQSFEKEKSRLLQADSDLARSRREILPRHLLTVYCLPNASAAIVKAVEIETCRQLALTAVGLKRFLLRKGNLPERLDELTPEILDAVPIDFWNGKPLKYRRTARGFLLYAVGKNAVDDSGNPTLDQVWEEPARAGD